MPTVFSDKVDQPIRWLRTRSYFNTNGSPRSDPQFYQGVTPGFTKERWWQRSETKPWVETLPYTVTRFRVWEQPYLWTVTWSPNWVYGYDVDAGSYAAVSQATAHGDLYSSEFASACSTLEESAKNACFDNIEQERWNTPVFFGELNKSVELVGSFASKCDRAARTLMSSAKNPKRAFRQMQREFGALAQGFKAPPGTDNAAKLWLLWRYAVVTGVLDIQNAARTTASLLLDKSDQSPRRVGASRSNSFNLSDRFVSDSSWGRSLGIGLSLGDNVAHGLTRVGQVHAKAWMYVERVNSFLTDANQLGLLNIPAAVWELTRLSFVADWLLDVGNFLDRCSAGIGFRISRGGYSVLRQMTGEHYVTVYGLYLYSSRVFSGERSAYDVSVYNRLPWVDPTPIWTPKLRMTTNRWLDAASLLRQIPLGKFKAF